MKTVKGNLAILLFGMITLLSCQQTNSKMEKNFTCPAGQEAVTIKKAIDGDTVELASGEKLRYASVNTTELHTDSGTPEPYAQEAYLRNKELVEGTKLCLEKNSQERDRFRRLLGELYFSNGTSISEILVGEGLALVCFYKGNREAYERLLPIQRRAIKAKVGLFSLLSKAPMGPYYGNRASKRVHHPNCSKDLNIKRMVVFKSLEEALNEGYCPVRTCTEYLFRR